MKKIILFLAFGFIIQLVVAQRKTDAQLSVEFDKLLKDQFKSDAPGGTALVSRKGEILYTQAFGMADLELNVPMQVDNVFRIASLTKQFTAVAIMQLMELRKLNLDDEITKFLPDYPTQGNKITIEHLLTHTSGISNTTELPEYMFRVDQTPSEIMNGFKNQPMLFAPGTGYSYSNHGYFLLGNIIEKVSGKTYAGYLEEHIFKPLEMDNSLYANDTKIVRNRAGGYSFGENGYENAQPLSMSHPFSAGAIQSTVRDLFKWNQALHNFELLKEENLKKAQSSFELTNGKKTDYGYGWRLGNVYDSPSVWHAGLINGFMSIAIYLPEEEVFVAILSNCQCNSPETVALKLAALAINKPTEHQEISLNANELQNYTGVYENEKGQQRIFTEAENKLFSQIGRGPKSPLKAYRKDAFFLQEDTILTLEFSENSNGEVERLTTKALNGIGVWKKTDKPIPSENGIKVEGELLEKYVGQYELNPDFSFFITKVNDGLLIQAQEQEKFEMFAETENKFFLKVNDAQFEFIRDDTGKVTKVILNQEGRQAEAKKVK